MNRQKHVQHSPVADSSKLEVGFTLIELLVYTLLLVILVSVTADALYAFAMQWRHISAEEALEQAAEGTLGVLVRDIRGASSINTSASTFDVSPGVLSLSTTDASGTAETLLFSLSNGALHLYKNGVDAGALSPSSATITSLIFRKIATSNSSAIKIEEQVVSGTSTYARSRSFYETAVVRGSYIQ